MIILPTLRSSAICCKHVNFQMKKHRQSFPSEFNKMMTCSLNPYPSHSYLFTLNLSVLMYLSYFIVIIYITPSSYWAFLVARMVKNLPAMQEIWVRQLGWEDQGDLQGDPLEKGMATHSIIIVWKIPRTEEPDGLLSMGSQKGGHN